MKLSRNSWHYWLYEFTNPKYSSTVNLCPYFWRVVLLAPLKMIGIGVLIALVTCILPFALTIITILETISYVSRRKRGYTQRDKFWKLVSEGTIPSDPGFWKYHDHPPIVKKGYNPPTAPKPPGLFATYFKAKKQKICPQIEFVDD